MNRRGFTLVETLAALLLLALLSIGVAMSFARPLASQQQDNALLGLGQFDADARAAAIARGRAVRLEYDLDRQVVRRLNIDHPDQVQSQLKLPPPVLISGIKLANARTSKGVVDIDISANGWSRTYAVCTGDEWQTVAGLSGEVLREQHEPTFAWSTRHDAD